uniref:Ig-like domain-containing protein n=1 Tax=Maylandia zebra TaxID=106582 RepID=A0A3P9ARR1_9CICH
MEPSFVLHNQVVHLGREAMFDLYCGFFFHILLILSCICCEVLVIGSNLPIIAAPGDDVILPCHLEPTFNVQGMTVEWSKPDLKPDPSDRLSRVEYVHLYRDRQEVPDMKMASYFRRTELFMDDMKHGNISLKILNVSEEDNGRYRCFIPKLQSRVKAAVVELVVGEKICSIQTELSDLESCFVYYFNSFPNFHISNLQPADSFVCLFVCFLSLKKRMV